MLVLKSLLWGYVGAVLAGLAIAVAGALFGMSAESVVTASAPAGMVCGIAGFSLVWCRAVTMQRPALERVRRAAIRRP